MTVDVTAVAELTVQPSTPGAGTLRRFAARLVVVSLATMANAMSGACCGDISSENVIVCVSKGKSFSCCGWRKVSDTRSTPMTHHVLSAATVAAPVHRAVFKPVQHGVPACTFQTVLR